MPARNVQRERQLLDILTEYGKAFQQLYSSRAKAPDRARDLSRLQLDTVTRIFAATRPTRTPKEK